MLDSPTAERHVMVINDWQPTLGPPPLILQLYILSLCLHSVCSLSVYIVCVSMNGCVCVSVLGHCVRDQFVLTGQFNC